MPNVHTNKPSTRLYLWSATVTAATMTGAFLGSTLMNTLLITLAIVAAVRVYVWGVFFYNDKLEPESTDRTLNAWVHGILCAYAALLGSLYIKACTTHGGPWDGLTMIVFLVGAACFCLGAAFGDRDNAPSDGRKT